MNKGILFAKDPRAIEREQEQAKANAAILQKVIDEVKTLDLFPVSKMSELESLVKKPTYAEDQIISKAEAPKFLGFKMKRKAIIESFEFPDMSGLNEAIVDCQDIHDFAPFELSSGKVTVSSAGMAAIEKRYSHYTRSTNEEKLVNTYQAAATAMDKFYKALEQERSSDFLIGRHSLPPYTPKMDKVFNCFGDGIQISESFISNVIYTIRRDNR